jgi:predicted PurR-regulated permease PerM
MGNGCPGNNPAASFSSPAVADGGAFPTICFRDNIIGTILFCAGFLLIIFLFTEEFARVLKWLQARLKRSLWCRIIFYPLLFLLIVAAGFIIATSLIKFSTTLTFSYD